MYTYTFGKMKNEMLKKQHTSESSGPILRGPYQSVKRNLIKSLRWNVLSTLVIDLRKFRVIINYLDERYYRGNSN